MHIRILALSRSPRWMKTGTSSRSVPSSVARLRLPGEQIVYKQANRDAGECSGDAD
jgi:hypothetical protein